MKSSQDAGWNDPPKFSYNESVELTRSPKKNLLNKRVAFPLSSTSAKPAFPYINPMAPPCNNPNLPPPPSVFPRTNEKQTAPNVDKESLNLNKKTYKDDISDLDINEIISSLEKVIERKRKFLTDNREDLIKKKLQVMEDSWKSDKISVDIKKQIFKLTNALKEDHKETANQIQIALMVDHPKLCSEFISAFRQLINADENNT